MDIEKISSVVTSICAAVVLLTPLVKALSTWHIALRKTSKPDTKAITRKAQTSTESVQKTDDAPWYKRLGFSGWLSIVGVLSTALIAFFGLSILFQLARSDAPLTVGAAAQMVLAASFLIVSMLKEWKP
jgi:hypothetical protein